MIWPLWSHISTSTPAPPALAWMPSPEFLLFLWQLFVLGCSPLLSTRKTSTQPADVSSSMKAPPDSSSKQTASLFVRKYFLTKYFILTFPFHYSAFTTLYGNYLAFLLPPWVQWQFLLCLCTLQCLSSDLASSTFSTSIWWLNRSSRTRTPIGEYSFSAYTNTAGYLKTKQFIVWQRLREVNMNIINCRASQNL